MPNQLSQSKKRMTIAEHSAVLAALETIAKSESLTVTDLIRHSARKFIAERASDSRLSQKMRLAVAENAPKMPKVFRTPAKLAKFKREQREYDKLLQELNLTMPDEIQRRNSLVEHPQNIRMTSFAG
jgi:predicted DNA-binding ribbon-helix-helix protein